MFKKEELNLILIGPMRKEKNEATSKHSIIHIIHYTFTSIASLLIKKIHSCGYLSDGAILLVIRPLQIGYKTCTQRFKQYKPPDEYVYIEH